MKIFELQSNYPIITAEALLISAFGAVWNRDKTKDKSVATKELAYVYFKTHYKSIYNNYPEEIREEKIIEDVFKEKYTPDKLVLEAVEKHIELQNTFNMRFLKSARGAAEKTMKYFDTVDYSERDDKGNFVYKVKEVTAAIKDCAGIIDTLDKLMEKVSKEQQIKESKQRGSGTGGYFEEKK